jgi:hypothetical protein
VDKLDVYAGLTLGWEIGSWSSSDYDIRYDDYSNFYYGFQGGARYFFTNNLGAFAELGFGLTYVKAGLAIKF